VRETTGRAGGVRHLEAGQFGEREVEIFADRLVFLLLAEQLVCVANATRTDYCIG